MFHDDIQSSCQDLLLQRNIDIIRKKIFRHLRDFIFPNHIVLHIKQVEVNFNTKRKLDLINDGTSFIN